MYINNNNLIGNIHFMKSSSKKEKSGEFISGIEVFRDIKYPTGESGTHPWYVIDDKMPLLVGWQLPLTRAVSDKNLLTKLDFRDMPFAFFYRDI